MNLDHIQQVSHTAAPLFTEQEVHTALDQMSDNIATHYVEKNPIVLCVLIGGLYTFSHIIARLRMPLQIDYVHASRYRGGTSGHSVTWKAEPNIDLNKRNVIIVDDILDGGLTLKEITEYCQTKGAISTATAVLLDKTSCRLSGGLKFADYTGLSINSNDYVFGCGMDYQTYLRNAPGIYAVNPALLNRDSPTQPLEQTANTTD